MAMFHGEAMIRRGMERRWRVASRRRAQPRRREAAGEPVAAPRRAAASLRLLLAVALASAAWLAAPRAARAQEHAAGPGQPPSVVLPPALVRVLRDYEAGWRTGDAQGVAALFEPRGMAMPNGQPAAQGRARIAEAYAGGGGPLRLRAVGFAVADSVAWILGGYRYGPGDGDTGKFVLALRRAADGRWMIAADIDNANTRPRDPTPRPATEAELVRLTEARVAADFAADRAALDTLLAPDLTYARSSGVVDDKAAVIAQVGPSGPYALDYLTTDSLRARPLGATGVVTGILRVKLKAQPAPYRIRFTDVWMERGGRRQLVAFQASRLP
jgi:ketosteroid isomerase-like protein